MGIYTTEIASDKLISDNPIHQRLLQAYFLAKDYVSGNLLEIGCGEGRGVELLAPLAKNYVAIDKIQGVIDSLKQEFPKVDFIQMNIPPLSNMEDNSFDTIVSFQVIEHIKNDSEYLKEIYRVLKPGGKAIITTPNIKKTLTRNPWHMREYTAKELKDLCLTIFDGVEMKGVAGNEKVMDYYNKNKESVRRITRFDILDLQHRLPASWLRVPYDLLNRLNRNKLNSSNDGLVKDIVHTDYILSDEADGSLDLFCIMKKAI